MQPGDTITPGASAPTPAPHNSEPPRQNVPPQNGAVQTLPSPQPALQEPAQPLYTSHAPTTPNPYQSTTRSPIVEPAPEVTHVTAEGTVSWTASEYMAHQKNGSWYILLAMAAIGSSLMVFLLTADIISSLMIVVVAGAFGVLAARQPRTLQYSLDEGGIHIAQKYYPYSDFKSFSVVDEGAISSIWLMPLKRFMPAISMYYAPEDEGRIADMLSQYLPYEDRARDQVDKLMHKIRF